MAPLDLSAGAYFFVYNCDEDSAIQVRKDGHHIHDTIHLLKPGPTTECILLCRKTLTSPTVIDQAILTGTGALQIDACRIRHNEPVKMTVRTSDKFSGIMNGGQLGHFRTESEFAGPSPLGRWPPNIIFVHSPECKPGYTRVDGHRGYPNGPGGSSSQFSQKGTATTRTGAWRGHADADGKETIPSWQCESGCPVRLFDEQTVNVGSISRFFPQFADREAAVDWLITLILPPGTVLFR
jgi:hypothetical protein